jgi:hypothetical protein
MTIQYWWDPNNEYLYLVAVSARGRPLAASEDPLDRVDISPAAFDEQGDVSAAGWDRLAEVPEQRFQVLERPAALALAQPVAERRSPDGAATLATVGR